MDERTRYQGLKLLDKYNRLLKRARSPRSEIERNIELLKEEKRPDAAEALQEVLNSVLEVEKSISELGLQLSGNDKTGSYVLQEGHG